MSKLLLLVLCFTPRMGVVMTFTKKTVSPRMFDRLRPALITGIALCLLNYGMDFALDRLRTSASKTILNDLAIGILGALAVFFFLSASRQKQNFESAKERIILIRERNLRIRDALGVVVTSAMSEERTASCRVLMKQRITSTTSFAIG